MRLASLYTEKVIADDTMFLCDQDGCKLVLVTIQVALKTKPKVHRSRK